MICPRCGVQANGRFCASCGARLQQPCAQCGAPLQPDDRFCGECGTQVAVPQDSSSAGNSRSSSVTIGDIGVMRGTIDQSTHAHTTIGSQMNVTGDLHLQVSSESEPTYEELMAQGRRSLVSRMYPQAKDSFAHAAQIDPMRAEPLFFLALATLEGNRPKLVGLSTIRKIEKTLEGAIAVDHSCIHAYLLLAIVKEDAYSLNGMSQKSPTSRELLVNVSHPDRQKVNEIAAHVRAPGNSIWESLCSKSR